MHALPIRTLVQSLILLKCRTTCLLLVVGRTPITCRHMFAGAADGISGGLMGNGNGLLAQRRFLHLLNRYTRGIRILL